MSTKNAWKVVTLVTVVVLVLANFGPANAAAQTDMWPDSLIGEWKGIIRSSCCSTETEIHLTITRGPDGRLIDTENFSSGPSIFVQEDYKQITTLDGITNYYYCFRWTGTDTYIVEDCLRVVDNNQIYLLYFGGKFGIEGASEGSLTRVGTTNQTQAATCQTTNIPQYGIINIGPDVFVILCGQRWLVPNPTTLDALGISRDMIDNMGLDDTSLSAIPRNTLDIPDINRDPNGFQLFMSIHGQEIEKLKGNVSATQIPQVVVPTKQQPEPLVEAPVETPETDSNWFCKNLGVFCPILAAEVPEFPKPPRKSFDDDNPNFYQCTEYVQIVRPDALCWLEYSANGAEWVNQLDPNEQKYLGVTHSNSYQVGDVAVWDSSCGFGSDGHVGIVVQGNCPAGKIAIADANHNGDGKIYQGTNYTCYAIKTSCMEFIHQPTKTIDVSTCTSITVNTKPYCDQFGGLRKWWCNLTGK